MVAQVDESPHNGLRPVRLPTDLGSLAELLEIGFAATIDEAGRAAIREMRALHHSGWLARALFRLDGVLSGLQEGFVWIEEGKLIGNVTLTGAHFPRNFGRGAVISNVVVHPDFRQRGLARSLLDATLDMSRRMGSTFAILQVDQANVRARALYERLGFRAERTFTRWVRPASGRTPHRSSDAPAVTLRSPQEWRAEFDLATLVRPNKLGGMGWLRPTYPGSFQMPPLKGLLYGLSGRADEPLIVYREPSQRERAGLTAALRLTMAFGASDRFDLLVHPFERGKLEDPLINYLLRRLEGRRRAVITEHPTDDETASEVFRKYGFEPRRTDIHMRLDFTEEPHPLTPSL